MKISYIIFAVVGLSLASYVWMSGQSLTSKKILVNSSVKNPWQPQKTRHLSSKMPARIHHVPDIRSAFIPDSKISLGNGHILTKDIGAVPREHYDQRMGELISEDKHFCYYKKHEQDDAAPVAYNPKKNRFGPISNVLYIKNVDAPLRQELIAAGYEEYYFNRKLKILFIKSTSTDVLALHENFKDKGLDSELEIFSMPYKLQ